jgi:hypothetical protein
VDWLTFIKEITKSLAWPVAVVVVALSLREYLRELLARLQSIRHREIVAEFVSGSVPVPATTPTPVRTPMEYKILNTLWIHQINHFPDYSALWTFRLNYGALEYFQFRESGNKLLGEGLVGETPDGQLYLTPPGYKFCQEHYKEFPPNKWFPETSINRH